MIESLESRTLFSSTPHAALAALRSDLAGIGQIYKSMIVANKAAIANIQSDMSLFPASYTTDNAALQQLNFQFVSHVSALANDFNNIKVLLASDITQLINKSNAYNRHPTAAVGLVVQSSQQLITSQAATASATLSQDATQMQNAYLQALAFVSKTHPLDTTLVTRTSHISTAFAGNVATIQSVAGTVATADVSNLITALEPNVVISSATA